MRLSYRKSISAGPFRFNLSDSGIGVSVGVPGFRVGSGPRGNYVSIPPCCCACMHLSDTLSLRGKFAVENPFQFDTGYRLL
ncbi:DUF4236 domain-containing protein [Paraburkholderia caribensis]|uniref:DUF4236 domain-containing protein n=1 Tax=Paraburkholderia caribensis TaxID=75105 RepID=UPI0035B5014D